MRMCLRISKKSSNFAAVMIHVGDCGWVSAQQKSPFCELLQAYYKKAFIDACFGFTEIW